MMAKNGCRKTSDTVFWGLFGDNFGIVVMILILADAMIL